MIEILVGGRHIDMYVQDNASLRSILWAPYFYLDVCAVSLRARSPGVPLGNQRPRSSCAMIEAALPHIHTHTHTGRSQELTVALRAMRAIGFVPQEEELRTPIVEDRPARSIDGPACLAVRTSHTSERKLRAREERQRAFRLLDDNGDTGNMSEKKVPRRKGMTGSTTRDSEEEWQDMIHDEADDRDDAIHRDEFFRSRKKPGPYQRARSLAMVAPSATHLYVFAAFQPFIIRMAIVLLVKWYCRSGRRHAKLGQ